MSTREILSFCRLADGPNKTLAHRFKVGDRVAWERANGEHWRGLVVAAINVVRNSCPHIRITATGENDRRFVEGCQRFFRQDQNGCRIGE